MHLQVAATLRSMGLHARHEVIIGKKPTAIYAGALKKSLTFRKIEGVESYMQRENRIAEAERDTQRYNNPTKGTELQQDWQAKPEGEREAPGAHSTRNVK